MLSLSLSLSLVITAKDVREKEHVHLLRKGRTGNWRPVFALNDPSDITPSHSSTRSVRCDLNAISKRHNSVMSHRQVGRVK